LVRGDKIAGVQNINLKTPGPTFMVIKPKAVSSVRQSLLSQKVRSLVRDQSSSLDFFNVLTGPKLLQVLEENLPEHRERQYPPTVTLAMFLGQVLNVDKSCQNAVNEGQVNRLLRGLPLRGKAKTNAYCMARGRLPLELVCRLSRHTAGCLSEHTPMEWLWRGRHVKLVDGTTVLLEDTPENQAQFPQHGNQKAGAGFPQARLVAVISLAHGGALDVAMGPCKGKGTGEHALLRQMLDSFIKGDVMLADSYYCSFFLIADLQARGVDFLFEQHGARDTDFRLGERLGARDHVVSLSKPKQRPDWMSEEQYEGYPKEITLREVRVRGKVLVTSFVNPCEVSKNELGKLFVDRWNVELDIRNIKSTLGMDKLRCKSPEMCRKEVWIYMLAYNLIRLLMAQAALHASVLPRKLSFKHTLQIWVAWSQRQFLSNAGEDLIGLFELIGQIRVGNRPGRVEPRLIKRRPKPFGRLQTTRRRARANIRKYGHPKKLVA
jgi:hypothetical protein